MPRKQKKVKQLPGRKAKYRGKLRGHGLAVRLTPFANVNRFRGMEARGLGSFYDYVEELIREDLKRRGVREGQAERRRREGASK